MVEEIEFENHHFWN